MQQRSILIDTDPGDDIDDMIALAFAVRRPDFDLKAVTTVTGRTDLRAHLVHALLRTAGRTQIPVGAGMPLPLQCTRPAERAAWLTTGGYRLNHYAVCSVTDRAAPVADGVDLIVRTVSDHPGEVTVVCIGPLTNIAAALLKEPALAERIPRIALMGGEPHLNKIEHNISSDPHATNVVLSSGIPIFMGTWDVTRRVILSEDDCTALRATALPLNVLLADAAAFWWPHRGVKPGAVVYDASALLWLLHPEWYDTEAMHLSVETRGEYTSGMVVRTSGEPNVEATTGMDAEAAKGCVMETLLR